jgi:tRNA A37 threonylcarbamoyltransferase TsaD
MAAKPEPSPRATAGLESIGAMMTGAAQAHARALELTQGWAQSVLGTLQEQATSYSALLTSVDTSLRATEQAIKSQAETTKAMAESLEASRNIVSTAMSAQQQTADRIETLVRGLVDVLGGQLETLRAQMQASQAMLPDPVAAQSNLFLEATKDWVDVYDQMIRGAATTLQHEDRE